MLQKYQLSISLTDIFCINVVMHTICALQVVLFDTSSQEDINVNEMLLNLLPSSFTKPQLPQVSRIVVVFSFMYS